MKKALQKHDNREIYFYLNNEKKIIDRNDKSTYPVDISGNISSGLTGNITGLYGNITGLTGNITGLYGDISSGLTGDISSGLTGDIDDCEITNEERKAGINIQDLINL